jgi:hypothetical protein
MAEKRGGDFGASWVASGDLSGSQFRLVTFVGNDCYLPGSGAFCAGVLQNKPKDNEHAAVIHQGFSKLFLGTSLGAQQEVMAGPNGGGILASSGQMVHAITLTAGNSGEIIDAEVVKYRKYA